jgi:hypothetical protein
MGKKSKYKIVNMKFMAEKAGIPYQKMYDNLILKKYDTLDFNERTLLSNALVEELRDLMKELGFVISVKRVNQ